MSFFVFLYFSFLLFLFHPASSRQPLCHDGERSALLRFKESFSIKKSISLDPSAYCKTELWNLEEDSDCCSWDGVECNEDTGYVIELDLGSSCLYGPINSTSNLFNLVHLQWLSLADNGFNYSKIPSEIKNLSNLSHLNLSYSIFSGQIPSEILELSKLESLALDRNNGLELQQPGLESLVQKLTNLRVLDLGGVLNISSSLPHVLSLLTDLSSLNFLSLANCNLKGNISSSIHNLNNLVHLDLSGNNLQGQIPLEMLELSKQPLCHDGERSALLRFKESLSINKSASDPSAYSKTALWNLEEDSDCCLWDGVECNEDTGYVIKLGLGSSFLYGSINSTNTLFHLVHLQWLDLADNDFNDSKIPSGIKNLSNLSHLNLSWSVFFGQIPLEILELSKLESLDLSGYNRLELQQPGLESLIRKLTNLRVLNLGRVNISSSLPHVLTDLSSLNFLSLANCNLKGQIPSEILELSQLEYLDLSWNSDLQPGGLRSPVDKLTNLKWLHLDGINISSSISTSLGNLSSLTHLSLSGCNLQGTIQSSIGSFTKLVYLDISSNNFRGKLSSQTLSSVLGNLTRLNTLRLSYNNFSSGNSSSWSWIAKHTKLTQLSLSGVNLAG
ncbi:hypothetical protein EZV62_020776 [Acer yangbiense]|uniref:Leucine-rich repeat-containing N-terminal plant-type domain-containing protein n=1 Tax=Acer yangbiense TaxID=1000413 RepID=A0A5C7HES2_9ROSI|nr:hypothetical protein EZV62_020776 [Acer yangbiense]